MNRVQLAAAHSAASGGSQSWGDGGLSLKGKHEEGKSFGGE
jgi:hypothetical protein